MDGKRNATAGKVATPKSGGQSTPDTLDTLSTSIGARIKLTTTAPLSSTLEGTLFTACPILNVLAINTTPAPPNPSSTTNQPSDYHIIPLSKIQNFQILSLAETSDGFTNASPAIGRVDTKKLQERADAKVKKALDEERKLNKDVGPEAQGIFNALDRMYSTRWHNSDIIVDDAVIIPAPYTADSCRAPKEKLRALEHVKKIVEGERRKIAERARAGGSGAVTPVPRKGG